MSESEWLNCSNLNEFSAHLHGEHREYWQKFHWYGSAEAGRWLNALDRKLRLLGCAWCRRFWDKLRNWEFKSAIEVAEKVVDGRLTRDRLVEVFEALQRYGGGYGLLYRGYVIPAQDGLACSVVAAEDDVQTNVIHFLMQKDWHEHRGEQLAVFRDIFGNPFRPLPPRPEAIAPLAERIYAGDWALMPILGEWLQEHGYWSEGEHCLDPNNQHVKGCWVVDWVTGRE
jgi:hypothetical protein